MNKHVFDSLREIVYRESGIVLSQEKLPLLAGRIQKRLNALGLQNESEYLNIIELDVSGEELRNLIDVVSTNVTYFYREEAHFHFLRDMLLKWKKEKRGPLKLWCAAASSGEEPYTIAFEACEVFGLESSAFKILATDICTPVLQRATRGNYSSSVVMKIPEAIRHAYLVPHEGNSSQSWDVRDEVREKVIFKKLNLVQFPYPLQGNIDIIFCRNVMIYFDRDTRARIVAEFERLLAPGGYLIVSHSENLLGINHLLHKITGSIFQKNKEIGE